MKTYSEIAGDGGSRILEQVEAQKQRIAAKLEQIRYRVAIASGKGGVGKSTLTWHLACALADLGWKAAILDADLNGPSQARLARLEGMTPVPGADGMAIPWSQAGVGVVSLGSFLAGGTPTDFPTVDADDSFLWRATQEFTALAQILAGVDWGTLDALLIDLPPGSERTVQFAQFLGADTAIVLVTQPSVLAREALARSSAALAGLDNRVLGFITNMQGYACPGCNAIQPLFVDDRPAELGRALGSVPFDPLLAPAAESGSSTTASAGTDAVRRIAAELKELLETE